MITVTSRTQRHSKSYWQAHIQQWKCSGQSKADYCRTHGLSPGNFYNWCSVDAKENPASVKQRGSEKPMKLLPVKLEADTDNVVAASERNSQVVLLESGMGRFKFPAGLPGASIEHWLQAIVKFDV